MPAVELGVDDAFPALIGRSSQSRVVLNHASVSRRHFEIGRRGGQWFVTDLGSRSGTFLNEIELPAHRPTPLRDGQVLKVRPWSFLVRVDGDRHSTLTVRTTDDRRTTRQAIRGGAGAVESRVARMAEQRLELLIETAGRVTAAKTESDLAQVVVDAAVRGTGYARAAFILSNEENVEVIASANAFADREAVTPGNGEDEALPSFSRSLLAAAANGELVVLDRESPGGYGESVLQLDIHSAMCAPVFLGDTVYGYLYLDARGREREVHADANPFAQAISRLLGLSLAGLKRLELQQSNDLLLRDLSAAAEAQRLLLPPTSGAIGGIEYKMVMRPGQLVAGDLFNLIELPDERVGVYIGDVTGHGIASAVLMTMTQTFLAGALKESADPAQAMEVANKELCGRFPAGRFVTLWMGVIDRRARTLWYVDAGHGYCLLQRGGGGRFEWIESAGSPPLAVTPSLSFKTERVDLMSRSRLLLLSDGIIEQRSPDGEIFGPSRVIEATGSDSHEKTVDRLLVSLRSFADTDRWEDDVTVALLDISVGSG